MATAASWLTASAAHSPSVVITLRRQFGLGRRLGPGSPVSGVVTLFSVLSWRFLRGYFSCSRRLRLFVTVISSSRQVVARHKSALGTGRLWDLVGQRQRQRQQHPRPSWPRGVPTRRKPCFQLGRPRDSGPTGNLLSVVHRHFLSSVISAVFAFAQSGFGLGSPLPSMVLP